MGPAAPSRKRKRGQPVAPKKIDAASAAAPAVKALLQRASKVRKSASAKPAHNPKPKPNSVSKAPKEIPDVNDLSDLSISNGLQASARAAGLSELSSLERYAMPRLLAGQDVVAISESRIETMLSFLVPAAAFLESKPFSTRHGTGVIVLTPTRESAVRVSSIASELLSHTSHTVGIAVNGAHLLAETEKLAKGVNLLVCTPTRLIEHFNESPDFIFKNLKALIVDEADKYGPEVQKHLKAIESVLPKERVTGIFSAIASDDVLALGELLCNVPPLEPFATRDENAAPVASSGPQGYVVVEADKRFLLLYSFLKKFQNQKAVVVLSSTAAVRFYSDLLSHLELSVTEVHGKLSTTATAAALDQFKKSQNGFLLGTNEIVQEQPIPPADWVIQYDPPQFTKVFAKQAGKLAGRGVIFLRPSELGFVEQLKKMGIATEEFEFPKKKLLNIQAQIEKLVAKNYELHCLAKDGFRSYLQGYMAHPEQEVFDHSKLDVVNVAKSFGFDTPPRVASLHEEKRKDAKKYSYGPQEEHQVKKRKI